MLAGERVLAAARRRLYRQFVDVRPSDERLLSRTRQDDRPHLVVALALEHRTAKLVDGLGIQRIQDLRPIDGHDDDRAVAVEEKIVEAHGIASQTSRVRKPCEESTQRRRSAQRE